MDNRAELIVMTAISAHPGAFRLDMAEWFSHPQNWLVWGAFAHEANRAWDRGWRHYSARTIGEVIRHHTNLEDSCREFKVNDHTWPDLGRLYMLVYPDRAGFFETRRRAAA